MYEHFSSHLGSTCKVMSKAQKQRLRAQQGTHVKATDMTKKISIRRSISVYPFHSLMQLSIILNSISSIERRSVWE